MVRKEVIPRTMEPGRNYRTMNAPFRSLAWGCHHLVRKAQSNRTVEACFWRLPFALRRVIVQGCRIDHGVPEKLAAEVLKRRTIFLHVPKTAGISVQQALFGGRLYRHESLRQYELLFTRKQLASFYKFAFVRNPWDRLVSAWVFLQEGGYGELDRPWSLRKESLFTDFESFVRGWVRKENLRTAYIHFKPQVYFLKDSRGQLDLDFLGHFESLADDVRRLSEILACPATLESHNRTKSRRLQSYREYYTEETAGLVAEAYEDDIQTFGYEF